MKRPGLTTIKTLFAHCCNRCAFPGCDERLTDPAWNGVKADIAHIRGEKPGAARYAPEMSDDERIAIENLVLLCPNHHREIDRLQPESWSAEGLMELKANHEANCGQPNWASDSMLEHLSSMLISASITDDDSEAQMDPPVLVVQDGPGDSFVVVNVGHADAFAIDVEPAPSSAKDALLRLEDGPLERLSPGGRWKAGLHVKTFGSSGPSIVRVRWADSSGHQYDGEFPL